MELSQILLLTAMAAWLGLGILASIIAGLVWFEVNILNKGLAHPFTDLLAHSLRLNFSAAALTICGGVFTFLYLVGLAGGNLSWIEHSAQLIQISIISCIVFAKRRDSFHGIPWESGRTHFYRLMVKSKKTTPFYLLMLANALVTVILIIRIAQGLLN